MLLSDTYVFSNEHSVRADVTASEVSGNGYAAGGLALANVHTVSNDVDKIMQLTSDTATWELSTISARYAVIYVDKGDSASDALVGCYDLESIRSSLNGNFTVDWSAGGFLQFS
jgi:hypothetical protein